MTATAQTTFAERAGRNLGRKWSGGMRLERRAQRWLVAHGLPAGVAKAVLLIVRLAVLGVVAYGAFWVAVLLVLIVVVARGAQHVDFSEPTEWLIDDPHDYRNSVFYDPIFYNDDSDPRFDKPNPHYGDIS